LLWELKKYALKRVIGVVLSLMQLALMVIMYIFSLSMGKNFIGQSVKPQGL
jgi:hypothetical protein